MEYNGRQNRLDKGTFGQWNVLYKLLPNNSK